jgi:hypothetical protein
VCTAGCGNPKGVVNGKVTLKKDGTPVSVGTVVTFWSGDKEFVTTQTGADGSYFLPDVPLGEVTVTVTAPSVATQALNSGRPAGESVKPIVPIPANYADPKKSPIKKTIQKGTQEINLEIELPHAA